MVICGGKNIVVDVLICSDSVKQFSDKELLVSQLCISVMQLLSTYGHIW